MSEDQTTRNSAKRGFTIVELLVAMLVGAVLALTVGSMLVFCYQAWSRNTVAVKAQTDASLALDAVAPLIRESGMADILIEGVGFADNDYAYGSELTFTSNSVRPNSEVIYQEGDQLIRQSDGFVLVEGGLEAFTAQFNPDGPRVEIQLVVDDARGERTTTIRTSIAPRN